MARARPLHSASQSWRRLTPQRTKSRVRYNQIQCLVYAVMKAIVNAGSTKPSPTALLLVPTRELALQTAQVAKELGKYLGIDVVVTTGGTSLKDDIMRFHGNVHVVVATPGRILDLAEKNVAKLNTCKVLVMDEVGHWSWHLLIGKHWFDDQHCQLRSQADKLLSEDFQKIIEDLISFLSLIHI